MGGWVREEGREGQIQFFFSFPEANKAVLEWASQNLSDFREELMILWNLPGILTDV